MQQEEYVHLHEDARQIIEMCRPLGELQTGFLLNVRGHLTSLVTEFRLQPGLLRTYIEEILDIDREIALRN